MAPILSDGMSTNPEARGHREEMIDYIRRHFADVLGDDASLLDAPGGLDMLATRVRARLLDRRSR